MLLLGVGALLSTSVSPSTGSTEDDSPRQLEAELLERAELIATQVTTFRGEEIDDWVSETQALAVDEYAEQVDGLFDADFRQTLRDNDVESTGTVESAYIQEMEGDDAVAFVVARQESMNTLRDDPVVDELRMEIELKLVGGEWLASNVEVLGPSPDNPSAHEPSDGR